MIRRRVHYSGRVQGVGFRFTTRNVARRYDVFGYVKNLPDGRVEVDVQGEDQQVKHFLYELAQTMHDFITDTQLEELPATAAYQQFDVRY